jgi:nucleoside-diphosphate kinase
MTAAAVTTERTLAIIKPDAVAGGVAGRIIAKIEHGGFKILAAKMIRMSFDDAAGFYAVHRQRPFFKSLCTFMTQGPCIPMVLEAENAIQRWRDLMGATDPAKAAAGTIRKEFASSIESNAVHGSDAPETAATEIAYFFNALEIHAR